MVKKSFIIGCLRTTAPTLARKGFGRKTYKNTTETVQRHTNPRPTKPMKIILGVIYTYELHFPNICFNGLDLFFRSFVSPWAMTFVGFNAISTYFPSNPTGFGNRKHPNSKKCTRYPIICSTPAMWSSIKAKHQQQYSSIPFSKTAAERSSLVYNPIASSASVEPI